MKILKKFLVAFCFLTAAAAAFANPPQTVTVTIAQVKAIAPMVSFKYVYASPCAGQYCYNSGSNEADGIPASAPINLMLPNLQNVFLNPPSYVQPQGPYYIWFGVYDAKTHQSTFPGSCEILLNANQNINTVTINPTGCTIS